MRSFITISLMFNKSSFLIAIFEHVQYASFLTLLQEWSNYLHL
jgi:hypothetical protein